MTSSFHDLVAGIGTAMVDEAILGLTAFGIEDGDEFSVLTVLVDNFDFGTILTFGGGTKVQCSGPGQLFGSAAEPNLRWYQQMRCINVV